MSYTALSCTPSQSQVFNILYYLRAFSRLSKVNTTKNTTLNVIHMSGSHRKLEGFERCAHTCMSCISRKTGTNLWNMEGHSGRRHSRSKGKHPYCKSTCPEWGALHGNALYAVIPTRDGNARALENVVAGPSVVSDEGMQGGLGHEEDRSVTGSVDVGVVKPRAQPLLETVDRALALAGLGAGQDTAGTNRSRAGDVYQLDKNWCTKTHTDWHYCARSTTT